MKNFIQCLALMAFFTSCTIDADMPTSHDQQHYDGVYSRFGDTLPQNSDNKYDIAGRIHNELLNVYYGGSKLPTTASSIATLVDSLANLNSDFVSIKGSGYVPVPVFRIEYLLTNRDSSVTRVLNSSRLSSYAKNNFKPFLGDLEDLIENENNYEVIYAFITGFEADVMSDTVLTAHDQEVILTTTSIARFTVHMKRKKPKKNEDPDWYWLIANIVAGTDGADTGTAEAISRAVVTGIVDNK